MALAVGKAVVGASVGWNVGAAEGLLGLAVGGGTVQTGAMCTCVCLCVCVRDRERESEYDIKVELVRKEWEGKE